MTRESFISKVNGMMKEVNEQMLPDRINKVLSSGCVDLESAGDDFILPKAFICAFFKDMERGYTPFSKEGIKISKNMELFM